MPALDLNERKRKEAFKAATASYNPAINPPAASTIARGQRGARTQKTAFKGTPLSSPLAAPPVTARGAPGRQSAVTVPTIATPAAPPPPSSGAFVTDPSTGQPYGPQGWSPGFQKLGQGITRAASLFAGGPVTPPLSATPPLPSLIQDAEARPGAVQTGSTGAQPTMADTIAKNSARHHVGQPAVAEQPPLAVETQNVGGIPGVNRYTDQSDIPTFTNKGRAGYDEMQGAPGISQESLNRTIATSPLFATRSAGGGSIDPTSAALAQKSFAADQAMASAAAGQQKAERKILKRLPSLPDVEMGNALTGLANLRNSQQRAIQKPLSFDQVKAARASGVSNELLFGNKRTPPAQRFIARPDYTEGFRTGTTMVDQATGLPAPGTQQAQPQPLPEGHTPESARANVIQHLRQDPTQIAALNQQLALYGIPPVTDADLKG